MHRYGYKPKYRHIEREQRFLLRDLPSDIDLASFVLIEDLYILDTTCRLRKMTNNNGTITDLKLTQKFVDETCTYRDRIITTMYLTEQEYRVFRTSLRGALLTKKRYDYLYNGMRFGIDEFQNELAGLILAEIECDMHIDCPPFALREVSYDERYTGGMLVTAGAEVLTLLNDVNVLQ